MSAKGLSGGLSMAVGALTIALNWYNPAAWIAGLSMVAAGGFSVAFNPSTNSPQALRAKDLQISTASDGTTVPVVFGTQKLSGNFIFYNADTLRNEEVEEDGGKGGSKIVTGYKYFLSFEQGLCMGPINRIHQIYSAPGDVELIPTSTDLTKSSCITTTTGQVVVVISPSPSITVVVASVGHLQTGQQIQIISDRELQKYNYTISSINAGQSKLTLTRTDPSTPPISLGSGSKILPKVPQLGSSVKIGFESTGGMAAGDEIVIADAGKFEVVTVHSSTVATCKLLEPANAGYVLPARQVRKKLDPTVNFDSDYEEVELSSSRESGMIRVFRGSDTQTRVEGGDPYFANGLNYRNVCWVLFQDFNIGATIAPRTYQFVVTRLPQVLLDDGTDLEDEEGFKVRGSDDSDHANWDAANPAAIVYEVMTNQIWGRGVSSDLIDIDSFVEASEYFAENDIGMSFVIESQVRMTDFVQGMLAQVKTVLVEDGGRWKMKVLLDTSKTHAVIKTLDRSHVSDVKFSRPAWTSTTNQIIAEYNAADRNFRPSTVTVNNFANFNTVGITNSERVSLLGFTDNQTALTQANRILNEKSYPLGSLNFRMDRFASTLEPGDILRLNWSEWSASALTGYFIITSLKLPANSETIEVSAIEDITLGFVAGTETSTTMPDKQPWEYLPDANIEANTLLTPGTDTISSITPITVFEVPALLTRGKAALLLIAGEKTHQSITGIAGYWALEGSDNFRSLGIKKSLCITGELLAKFGPTPPIDRSSSAFTFSLTNTENEAAILEVNDVPGITGDMTVLTRDNSHWFLIGNELLQVGYVEKIGTNQFRAKNTMRGQYSDIVAHQQSENFFYFPTFPGPELLFDGSNIPTRGIIKFRGNPFTTIGELNASKDIYTQRP